MSKFGLRVRDVNNNIILDSSDWAIRVRYYITASANSGGSIDLPDISGHTTELVSIPLEVEKLAHDVSRSGTVISWVAKSDGTGGYSFASSDSLVLVILTN